MSKKKKVHYITANIQVISVYCTRKKKVRHRKERKKERKKERDAVSCEHWLCSGWAGCISGQRERERGRPDWRMSRSRFYQFLHHAFFFFIMKMSKPSAAQFGKWREEEGEKKSHCRDIFFFLFFLLYNNMLYKTVSFVLASWNSNKAKLANNAR